MLAIFSRIKMSKKQVISVVLLMLVNDVLDFTKIESGKIEIKESDFSMSEMLFDVISLIEERAEEKNLTLTTEIVDEVPDGISSDEFRIRQILINLLNNAVKYTEKAHPSGLNFP